jgi:hypothetical protein
VFYTHTRTLLYQNTLHIRYRVLIGCLENYYKNHMRVIKKWHKRVFFLFFIFLSNIYWKSFWYKNLKILESVHFLHQYWVCISTLNEKCFYCYIKLCIKYRQDTEFWLAVWRIITKIVFKCLVTTFKRDYNITEEKNKRCLTCIPQVVNYT